MIYNIFRKGGYFYIIAEDGREYSGLIKNVYVTRGTTVQDDFYFNNIENWDNSINVNLSNIRDYDNNTYTLEDFVRFYENNSIDVNIQDSDSSLIIVPFSKIVTETTLTSETAIDDHIISVASANLFVIGQLLTIYDVDTNRVYFAKVTAINSLDISLDTPLDFNFPIGSFVSVGDINMNVDGSVTPQIFGVRNPTGEDIPLAIDITRIIFSMLTSGAVDLSKFGDINGGLVNGLVLRKADGTYRNVFNVKTNAELKEIMYDVDIQAASGNQQDGLTGRFTFGGQEKLGAVIRLRKDEDLQFIVQDDLTSLQSFTVTAEGSEVID